MANRWGKCGNSVRFCFPGLQNHRSQWLQPRKLKDICSLERIAMTNLDSVLKSRNITLPTKVHLIKAMVFPIIMYICELNHKESWASKNWCFWPVVLAKTLESPLDYKEIKPVSPNGNKPWIFIGRTDAKAEAPILWPLMWKADSLEKTLILGKTESKKRAIEDKMVGWHHWLSGHEFEQALGDSEAQRSLACCSPWGCEESDTA